MLLKQIWLQCCLALPLVIGVTSDIYSSTRVIRVYDNEDESIDIFGRQSLRDVNHCAHGGKPALDSVEQRPLFPFGID